MREFFITKNVNERRIIAEAIELAEEGVEVTVHYHKADEHPCNEACKIYILDEEETE